MQIILIGTEPHLEMSYITETRFVFLLFLPVCNSLMSVTFINFVCVCVCVADAILQRQIRKYRNTDY